VFILIRENYNRFDLARPGSIIAAMRAGAYQFRLCLSPDCGLRYPVSEKSAFGERCPACLGETIVVAESVVDHERQRGTAATPDGSMPQAILDNIRSALNVGSMFRTAEGYGFEHLYLCGVTPTPAALKVRKTALGAEALVGWSVHRNAVTLVSALKGKGDSIWALERTAKSRPLETARRDAGPTRKHILVVGNEQAGIDPGILELADQVVHLEMKGAKRSFNVAVAFAIAAHVMCSQG
jgi:23S rRNA (guanosine2251-2'-O)-methyltransferase